MGDLLSGGRSNLPGFVLRMDGSYFIEGYFSWLKYFRGLAPEKDSSCLLMQQSPQNS